MKKIVYLLSFLLLAAPFTACTSDDDTSIDSETSDDSQENTDDETISSESLIDKYPDGINSDIPVMETYTLTATGQTILYDNDGNIITALSEGDDYYGQDGSYQAGAQMSYINNGDGTITDNNTGLMWQQIPSSESFTWEEAKDYCENLTLGGYDDWRMPSTKELYSISNFQTGWPYIDTDFFNLVLEGQVSKDEQYWSSILYVGQATEQSMGMTPPGQDSETGSTEGTLPPPSFDSDDTESTDGFQPKAFGVNYGTGHIKAYAANAGGPIGGNYVRAVRGNRYGENNFTDNGDETITDSSTGLMWAKNECETPMEWKEALKYAEESTLAGYDDWRLPNVKELQNIVDYDYSPSAVDESKQGPAINPIFNCTKIENEAGDEDYGYYWTSTSARFQSGTAMCYAWYVAFGRAVGGDGIDVHGAGAVRYDTKYEGGDLGEGGERYYNYVRLVRNTNK